MLAIPNGRKVAGLLAATMLCLAGRQAGAVSISLERPGEREFVRDLAGMITGPDQARIRAICDRLLTDKATPIIVVTIESMAAHGGSDLRIETFARLVFDQWEIGQAQLAGQAWNTGILLLVSKGDGRARIELGGGWKRDKDALCQQIMDQQTIPRFKQGEFSAGIVAGVEALEKMARGLELPKGTSRGLGRGSPSRGTVLLWAVIVGLGAFTVVRWSAGARAAGPGCSGGPRSASWGRSSITS
jgi:uncharacterized protein